MLLDSNILIACFEAEPAAVSFVLANQRQYQPLFVSIISVTEMLSLRNLTEDEMRRIFVIQSIWSSYCHKKCALLVRSAHLCFPPAVIPGEAVHRLRRRERSLPTETSLGRFPPAVFLLAGPPAF